MQSLMQIVLLMSLLFFVVATLEQSLTAKTQEKLKTYASELEHKIFDQ